MSVTIEKYSMTESPEKQTRISMKFLVSFKPWNARVFITIAHIIGLVAFVLYSPAWQSYLLTFAMFQIATMGITMGYHRLWSHKSYKASTGLQLVLAIAGTMAFQGSIRWWVIKHRAHHRWTDSACDPYNAKRGFWYSHIGWLYVTQHNPRLGWIDTKDLDGNWIVKYQHIFYVPLALGFGIVLPASMGLFWGDFVGALLYGGIISHIFIWHSTFFINSLAHMLGDQDFSTENTSRGNWVLALLTQGEGHHNFHHEFPQDYRNGIRTMDWDPTKWLISICSSFGLAWDLKTVPDHVIMSSKLSTCQLALDEIYSSKDMLHGGIPKYVPDSDLPIWSEETYLHQLKKAIDQCQELCIFDGYVLDVTDFSHLHPGGRDILVRFCGKDITSAFLGSFNNHTKSAKMMARALAVARVPWSTIKNE